MAFLFLDECSYEPLDLAALTGVLVPVERYVRVRDAICKVAADVLHCPPNTVPAPMELHASVLLKNLPEQTPGALDPVRLEVFDRIVELVNDEGLTVFRVAYLNRAEIAQKMVGDPQLYGLNFLGMLSVLQEAMRDTLVLAVMDGIPGSAGSNKPPRLEPHLIRAFAQSVRWTHHVRQYPAGRSISIDNVANLAEPVFADSAHSTLLQLVDIVSFLLLQIERDELEPDLARSVFRQAVLERARKIRPDLVRSWKGRMRFGQPPIVPEETGTPDEE